MSLALGVLIVSIRGSNVDLLHVLFGTVLALDDAALFLIAAIATLSLMTTLAVIYRPLVLECFDPQFLRSVGAQAPHAPAVSRPRGAQSGRRLPGAGHADGGRHHAAARDHRALLGAKTVGT